MNLESTTEWQRSRLAQLKEEKRDVERVRSIILAHATGAPTPPPPPPPPAHHPFGLPTSAPQADARLMHGRCC